MDSCFGLRARLPACLLVCLSIVGTLFAFAMLQPNKTLLLPLAGLDRIAPKQVHVVFLLSRSRSLPRPSQ